MLIIKKILMVKLYKSETTFQDRTTNKNLLNFKGFSLYTENQRCKIIDKWLLNLNIFEDSLIFGDFGAASGITSLNFHERAKRCGLKIETHIIERVLNLYKFSKFPFAIYTTKKKEPIAYSIFNLKINWINRRIYKFFRLKFFIDSYVNLKKRKYTKIVSLRDKYFDEYLSKNKSDLFYFEELDFLKKKEAFIKRFNLIRLAHVLTPEMVKKKSTKNLFELLTSYLKSKNSYILIVERDKDALLLKKKSSKLYVANRFGDGCHKTELTLRKHNLIK